MNIGMIKAIVINTNFFIKPIFYRFNLAKVTNYFQFPLEIMNYYIF
jgi:hypothetical protein